MPPKRKSPPKLKADPLAKITQQRKAAESSSRKATVRGTFTNGTRSANSSNAGANTNQRRDRRGRFT